MQKVFLLLISVLFLSTSFHKIDNTETEANKNNFKQNIISKADLSSGESLSTAEELYSEISFENGTILNNEVFYKAFLGFENLKKEGKLNENSHLLTICDFSLSSNKKRLWVIDLNLKKVVFNELVAHGKNTGEEFAEKFSNIEGSLQSSFGFFVTETTYDGNNGYSLKLEGMDDGYNDKAMQRAIVMHGADYVSENFIGSQKRLGRSWGCPAVSRELAKPIINTIKGKNVLFIYYPNQEYLANSKWLKNA